MSDPTAPAPTALTRPLVGPALVAGLWATVLMWILWYPLRHPSIDAPIAISKVLISLGLLAGIAFGVSRSNGGAHARPGWQLGLLAGAVAGVLNLGMLGMLIVEQPETTTDLQGAENALRPEAWMVFGGFFGACLMVGAVGGLLGAGLRKARESRPGLWAGRLGLAVAASILPLIVAGGVVTSTEAGMAVPDAVTTYGANPILFPLSLMSEPRIFAEHAHRLLGWLVGAATLIWACYSIATARGSLARFAPLGIGMLVGVQGVMGATRVSENSTGLAIFHGSLSQVILALAAMVVAVQLAPRAALSPDESRGARRAKAVGLIALGALFLQLVFGAMYRHLNSDHALYAHIGWSFIVFGAVIVSGAFLIRAGKVGPGTASLRPFGIAAHAIVTVQFLLGWAALGMSSSEARAVPTADELATAAPIDTPGAIMATIHQSTGALLFACVAMGAALAWTLATRSEASNPADAE